MDIKMTEIISSAASEIETQAVYAEAVRALTWAHLTVSVAESCTGGLMGKLFTDVSGASAVFSGGMITYTNNIKINKLGVSADTIDKYTEVSYECAAEMAVRAREYFETDIGISATGYAGPTGGGEKDPVGTVYLGIATAEGVEVKRLSFGNIDREKIRYGTAKIAAESVICAIKTTKSPKI